MQVAFEDVRVNNGFICTQRRTLSGFGVHSSSGATVRVAGKVGELAQGVDEEGAFLVSGAISAGPYAGRASIVLGEALRVDSVDGMTKPKAFRAASRFLELHGVDPAQAGRVILETTTPVGKGLGSSSVDSALAIFAVARANDLPAHPKVVYRVLCSVERSDPVWMAGELTFTRPESGTYEVWGPQPRMLLVVWDTDPLARVDTAAAARLDADRKRHVKAYQDILSLIRSGRTENILQAATLSASLNNRWLPKPGFDRAAALAKTVGGGVICSHSGTYLGILLPPDVLPQIIGRVRSEALTLGGKPQICLMGVSHG